MERKGSSEKKNSWESSQQPGARCASHQALLTKLPRARRFKQYLRFAHLPRPSKTRFATFSTETVSHNRIAKAATYQGLAIETLSISHGGT